MEEKQTRHPMHPHGFTASLLDVAAAQDCLACGEPMPAEMLGQDFCSYECAYDEPPTVQCYGCGDEIEPTPLANGKPDPMSVCRDCAKDLGVR